MGNQVIFLLTFQCVLAHVSHHIVPHYNGYVRPRLLDSLGHRGHMTEEKLLHSTSRRPQPQLGVLTITEHVNLEAEQTSVSDTVIKLELVARRQSLTSSAPMCSVFRPGWSSTTCLTISNTSFTPSSLWGFRVPTHCDISLRCHMGRCFKTNYERRAGESMRAAKCKPKLNPPKVCSKTPSQKNVGLH